MTSSIPEAPLDTPTTDDVRETLLPDNDLSRPAPALIERLRALAVGTRDTVEGLWSRLSLATDFGVRLLESADAADARGVLGVSTGGSDTSQLPQSRVPARVGVRVTKALAEADHAAGAWPTARPTVPTGVYVIWQGDTDPGDIAVDGVDRWDWTPPS